MNCLATDAIAQVHDAAVASHDANAFEFALVDAQLFEQTPAVPHENGDQMKLELVQNG